MFPLEGNMEYDQIKGEENEIFTNPKGYLLSASVFAPIIIIAILITFFGVKEPDVNKPNESSKKSAKEAIKDFIYGLKDTFTNKALVLVLFMYLFSWLIINMVQNNIYLWVRIFIYCLTERQNIA